MLLFAVQYIPEQIACCSFWCWKSMSENNPFVHEQMYPCGQCGSQWIDWLAIAWNPYNYSQVPLLEKHFLQSQTMSYGYSFGGGPHLFTIAACRSARFAYCGYFSQVHHLFRLFIQLLPMFSFSWNPRSLLTQLFGLVPCYTFQQWSWSRTGRQFNPLGCCQLWKNL